MQTENLPDRKWEILTEVPKHENLPLKIISYGNKFQNTALPINKQINK